MKIVEANSPRVEGATREESVVCNLFSERPNSERPKKTMPTAAPCGRICWASVTDKACLRQDSPGCTFIGNFDWDFLVEEIMIRRQLLSKTPQLFGLGLLGLGATSAQETTAHKPLKIMMKSAWGSDDPTKAAFPFLHGHALAEAGHEVQIFLLGEAVSVMRKSVASSVVPVGWPPLADTLDKVVAKHIQIYACGACCRARGVVETDLSQWGAKFGNPTIFVSLVEWADRIITE